ncbi:MAG: hypothetical protein IKR62_03555 [Victivallales bacterium]|nr:hypothetical protein [Victivallales bacterium]
MKRRIITACLTMALMLPLFGEYQIQPNQLMTPWGEKMTPENAWREYPRPQLVRQNWQNLNGLWQFAVNERKADRPDEWAGEILVPFAIETPLSGVKRLLEPSEQLWYRRVFNVAFNAAKERVLLHFGGVDFRTQVFVNGVEATDVPHESGNLPFSLDITDFVKQGENELVLQVWDPTDAGVQSRGKQVQRPGGCMYTRMSGIWQTVWTETVPATYITGYKVVTDIDNGTVSVTLQAVGDLMNAKATIAVQKDGKTLASNDVAAWGRPVTLKLENPLLWSPETPNLYDLVFTLTAQDGSQDVVKGYFGMRKIDWRKDEKGVPRLYLNNQKTFMMGTLDQGWWPDGFLTPPSDEAMVFDIDFLKRCGFNMMRKHIKIEPLRYYYLCDKLGIMLWQDMPSGGGDVENRYQLYRQELKGMMDLLQTFPSIVMWVPYNEGWGQPGKAKTNQTMNWVKRYDPTRLVDGPSGWTDYGVGDTKDMHHYSDPRMFPVMDNRVSVLGEFGGIGFQVKNHLWAEKTWGYVSDASPDAYFARYTRQMNDLARMAQEGLAASVYTQTTDVEIETNGLLTYDRKVEKVPAAEFAKVHQIVYEAAKETRIPVRTVIMPSSQKEPLEWRYTFENKADNWMAADFDDTAWQTGQAGFGNAEITRAHKASRVRTSWETNDIWIRRAFDFDGDPAAFKKLGFSMFFDEDTEVYLNGVKIAEFHGFNTNYDHLDALPDALKALKKDRNVVAVHTKNTVGGAYIDFAILGINFK